MRVQIKDQMAVKAPASKVWQVLAHEFDKIGQWSSGITESRGIVDISAPVGAPVGGRVCLSPGFGGDAEESFTYYDEQAMRFGYKAIGDLPWPWLLKSAENNWRVHLQEPDTSMVEFRAEVDVKLLPGLLLLPNWSYLAVRLRLFSDQWTRPRSRFPWDNALDFAPGWTDAGWDLYRAELSIMRKVTETAGGRLTIIMFPFAPQFREHLLAADKDYVLKPQRIMKQICDENGVPLLDMYPILAAAGGADLQPDRIHLSDEGHRITADALYEHLVSHNLIPAATGETEDKH